ncbi:hypothetical protein GYMLUDRAFT_174966 [Collybiopsis luxurians FD-317 M1]|uniref:DUF6536 domain-containing protein n=1 Tax=Collybiopsis luxurians FD-317 M1 TaxID=944289 RepID=A0A0D0BM16_9AGAR|nr:hypothetical protein GYMLUDRAFT_174966 [Collybiopsis luxurians FD-317 M1]
MNGFRIRLPTGWRFGAWLAVFQAGTVLLMNIAILIWSTMKARGSSIGVVFQGDCNQVDQISTGIHLVINVLSTLLLGASNYIMQSLCAPTRVEVDNAHKRGAWLDIGVQSVRNLTYTSRRKQVMWIALAASAIPLHLFYNSSFFSTLSANEYHIYFAQGPDVEHIPRSDNGTYNWGCSGDFGCSDIAGQADISSWEVLNPSECLKAYAVDFGSERSDLVAVVGSPTTNNTLIGVGDTYPGDAEDPFRWICQGMEGFSDNKLCSSIWTQIDPSHWKVNWWVPATASDRTLQVNYCISEPAIPKCQLEFSLPLLILVIICNIVKVVCMAIAAMKIKDNPLVTIGDAIASFTDKPDPHTRDMCLASKRHFDDGREGKPFSPLCIEYGPRRIRWLNAASRRHWILTVCLFVIAIAVILGLLGYAVYKLRLEDITGFSALWQFGLGKPHSQNVIQGWDVPSEGSKALISAVLISNSPQLILSMIYLIFNSLCTTMFLAREWSSYAHTCKPLRVSSPRGQQRSTYFLQIPYRFGLPLMIYSALLHWLVSQSIFLVKVTYWQDGILDPYESPTSCGYSPTGMILTTIFVAGLILSVLAIGFFIHLSGEMPLVGSCSAAISSACHPPMDGSDSFRCVEWGVVADKDYCKGVVGHICFSSGVVEPPISGYSYS